MATDFRISKRKRPEPSDLSRLTSLTLATATLLLVFALGARGLNAGTFWADELSTLRHIGAFDPMHGVTEIFASLSTFRTMEVPLFFILGAMWAGFGGWTQFSLLLLPLWVGTLMLAWLYRLAADLHSRRTAVVAVCPLGTNSFAIIYFHELRPYTLLMLFSVMHIWCYWRATHKARFGNGSAILFVISASALIYTHLFSVATFAGLLLYHAMRFPRLRRARSVVAGWVIAAATLLPFLPRLETGFSRVGGDVRVTDTLDLLNAAGKLLTNGCEWLWIPLLLSLVLALWRRPHSSAIALAIMTIGMFVALAFIQLQFNIFATTRIRYTFSIWPLIVFLFAFGLVSLPRWPVFTLLFLLIWMGCGFEFFRSSEVFKYAGFTSRTQQYPPLNEYVFHLQDEVVAGDYLIGFTYLEQINLTTRFSGQSVSGYYLQAQLGIDGVFLHANRKRYRLDRDVRDILAAHPHVLLAHDPNDVPLNYAKTLEVISEDFIPCAILVDVPDLYIRRYAHPVLGCENQATAIEYENGISVLDFAARFDVDSETVESLIWWDIPDENMLHEFNISLQIITPEWENIRQTDRHLYNRIVPWNVIELSTDDLPAGDYRLMLIVYNRDTLDKVPGISQSSDDASGFHTLLAFSIDDD